jgi:hypothetical protein
MKKWFKSKTINWSLLIGMFAMLEMNLPELRGMLGEYYGVVFVMIAAINIWLRTKTDKPLKEK